MNKIQLDKAIANSIIGIVNKYFDIQQETKCRKVGVMLPRQISQYFIRKKLKLSYKAIANMFNLKQHGTIMSNVDKIEYFSINDKEVSLYVKEIELLLRGNPKILLYRNSLDVVEQLTEINKILDVKSVFQLRKIKEYLLGSLTKI